jgi:hypothetical protein
MKTSASQRRHTRFNYTTQALEKPSQEEVEIDVKTL